MLNVVRQSWREIVENIPSTGRDIPAANDVQEPPKLDEICAGIDNAIARLEQLELKRAHELREFDEIRATYSAKLQAINDEDELAQEALITLQRELRDELEKRRFLVPVSQAGELSAVIMPASPRAPAELLPDLDNIDPRQVKP